MDVVLSRDNISSASAAGFERSASRRVTAEMARLSLGDDLDGADVGISATDLVTATTYAEAAPGPEQQDPIGQIYVTRYLEDGLKGLRGSMAYVHRADRFKIAMYVLGHADYGNDSPQKNWLKVMDNGEARKALSIQEYVRGRSGFRDSDDIIALRDKIRCWLECPELMPYYGFTGQGNLGDINNKANGEIMWKMARAYYWEQVKDCGLPRLVVALGTGRLRQFIFDLDSIVQYWKCPDHQLPQDVPLIQLDSPVV